MNRRRSAELRPAFFTDSAPPPSPCALAERFDGWRADVPLNSGLVVVGFVPPSEELITVLALHTRGRRFGPIKRRLAGSATTRAAFQEIVRLDMERSGLQGDPVVTLHAGDYAAEDVTPWRQDQLDNPTLIWTLDSEEGVGSIRGAQGRVQPVSMLESDGTVSEAYVPGAAASTLQVQEFLPGRVVRRGPGDVYADPVGVGLRIQFMARLAVS